MSKFVTLDYQHGGGTYTYDTVTKAMELFRDLDCFVDDITFINMRKSGNKNLYKVIYQGAISDIFQTSMALPKFVLNNRSLYLGGEIYNMETSTAPPNFIFKNRKSFCRKLENLILAVFDPFVLYDRKTKYIIFPKSSVSVTPDYLENDHQYSITAVFRIKLDESEMKKIDEYFTSIADSTKENLPTKVYILD